MIALFYTRELLKKGKTIFLFPEGKIYKKGSEMCDFKRGIEFFVKESKNVVFARMRGFNEIKPPYFRAKCSITFSPVHDLTSEGTTINNIKIVNKVLPGRMNWLLFNNQINGKCEDTVCCLFV